MSYEEVLRIADRALYEAKASGRNQGVGIESMRDAGDASDLAELWSAASLAEVDGNAIRLRRVKE